MDFPTPTPFPEMEMPFEIGLPDGQGAQLATDVLQWWNIGQQHNVTQFIQVTFLLIIIVGGIVAISLALRGFNE